MDTYSVDFAKDPRWSGEGFRFVHVCGFEPTVKVDSIPTLLRSLSENFHVRRRIFTTVDRPEWWELAADELTLLLERSFDWSTVSWIHVDAVSSQMRKHEVEIDLYPDSSIQLRLSVGGPSYWFYHGSREADLAYATTIASIVVLGVRAFGSAHGCFAADGHCEHTVEQMQRSGQPPNVTSRTTSEELAEYIVSVCDDTRLRG